MSGYGSLRLERIGSVLRVTIANPRNQLNTVDAELHSELARLFRELRREDEARAVVLTGEGRTFSAGGDFGWFGEIDDAGKIEHVRRDGKQIIWDLLDLEVPIVAAVNGPAVGLGASIALLCDVVFMADTATLADPHVRVGIVAGDGGAAIWTLALGPARAKRFLLTGDPVSAAEAERMGLVTSVVEAGLLQEEALAFAQRLAAGAPIALRHTKIAVNKLVKEALNTAFDYSTAAEMLTLASEDHREAVRAIREKRPPEFRGR